MLFGQNRDELQHTLMECLAEMIWQAQRDGELPDEERYIACIETLAEDGWIAQYRQHTVKSPLSPFPGCQGPETFLHPAGRRGCHSG